MRIDISAGASISRKVRIFHRDMEIAVRIITARGPLAAVEALGWPLGLAWHAAKHWCPAVDGDMEMALDTFARRDVQVASQRTGLYREQIVAAAEQLHNGVRRRHATRGLHDHLWSAKEDAVLQRLYGRLTIERLQARFPGRSEDAVRTRAKRLGLMEKVVTVPWSDAEDVLLLVEHGNRSSADLAGLFPGRSANAIRARHRTLILKKAA
jgi:hypothetical protein